MNIFQYWVLPLELVETQKVQTTSPSMGWESESMHKDSDLTGFQTQIHGIIVVGPDS